jgi:transcriptional antiterminator NusG
MTTEKKILPWYVLHTRSRFENKVQDGLLKKRMEVFLPTIKVKSRRKDRQMMIEVPLFPGYLFVSSSLHPMEHIDIVKTRGAVRLVGSKDGPVPVSQETVESLRIMVATDQPVITGNRLRRGDKVVVISGPFTGVTGTFVRYRGLGRVVVNIEALGQNAGVDVKTEDIELLPKIMSYLLDFLSSFFY